MYVKTKGSKFDSRVCNYYGVALGSFHKTMESGIVNISVNFKIIKDFNANRYDVLRAAFNEINTTGGRLIYSMEGIDRAPRELDLFPGEIKLSGIEQAWDRCQRLKTAEHDYRKIHKEEKRMRRLIKNLRAPVLALSVRVPSPPPQEPEELPTAKAVVDWIPVIIRGNDVIVGDEIVAYQNSPKALNTQSDKVIIARSLLAALRSWPDPPIPGDYPEGATLEPINRTTVTAENFEEHLVREAHWAAGPDDVNIERKFIHSLRLASLYSLRPAKQTKEISRLLKIQDCYRVTVRAFSRYPELAGLFRRAGITMFRLLQSEKMRNILCSLLDIEDDRELPADGIAEEAFDEYHYYLTTPPDPDLIAKLAQLFRVEPFPASVIPELEPMEVSPPKRQKLSSEDSYSSEHEESE